MSGLTYCGCSITIGWQSDLTGTNLLVVLLIPALWYYVVSLRWSNDLITIGKSETYSIPKSYFPTTRTAQIVKNADGWYAVLTLQDVTVPTISPNVNLDRAVGIDMGLKDFLITSNAETVPIPQFARKAEKDKKLRNKAVSRKKKGSNRRRKAVKRLAKHHQKTARQRTYFHYKTANQLIQKYDLIGFEDLNVRGLAKTRMAKSILDAGWSEFLSILVCKAESAGKLAIAVNPNGTTQNCSNCGSKVPKTLADRWHSCHVCGLELDRDVNAAINVRNIAVGRTVIKAQRVTEPIGGVAEKPAL